MATYNNTRQLDSKDPAALYDTPTHDEKRDDMLDASPVLKSKFAHLSKWETLKTFKRLYATGLGVSLGGMYAGYCLSVSGNIIANPGFIQQFGTVYDAAGKLQLNALPVSLWSGFYFVAQVVFQCISPFIVDNYGRRVGMYCFAGFMLAAIITEITARNWTHWLASRLLGGFSTAFLGSAVMTYMSEIAPTQIRGAMLSAFALSFALGQFFIAMGLQILFKTNPMAYRNCLYSQFVIFGLFASVLVYIPESPNWLCRQGRHDKGKRALRRLVGNVPGYDVDYEYSVIQSELDESTALAAAQGSSDWAAIFKWINFKRVVAATLPFTYQNFVGVPLVYGQTTYFFQMAGLPDPFLGKTTQSVVQLFGLVSSFYLVEKIGRRTLVLFAGGVLALFNFAIGGVGFAQNSSAVGSGLITLFCVWTFVYATSLAPIGWVGVVEVSSPRLRAKTAAIATVLQSLSGIVFNYTVPLMLSPQYLGWRAKIGLFFGGITILFWIPCYFLFPETKDRTYAELDELYQSGVPVRKFASVKLGGASREGIVAA